MLLGDYLEDEFWQLQGPLLAAAHPEIDGGSLLLVLNSSPLLLLAPQLPLVLWHLPAAVHGEQALLS